MIDLVDAKYHIMIIQVSVIFFYKVFFFFWWQLMEFLYLPCKLSALLSDCERNLSRIKEKSVPKIILENVISNKAVLWDIWKAERVPVSWVGFLLTMFALVMMLVLTALNFYMIYIFIRVLCWISISLFSTCLWLKQIRLVFFLE